MTALLAAAVAANVQWCQRVCRAHGISSRTDQSVWFTDSPTPPFYPDAITTDPAASAALVEEVLGDRRPAAVKDSYARLDLSRAGFESLFTATWIGLDRGVEDATGRTTWEAVSTRPALAEWSAAHGATDVFRPSLLADPAVLFLASRKHGHLTSGAIANRAGPVVGVSNVFALDANDSVWPQLVAELSARFPGVPTVGYERDADLVAARAAGFTDLGPLRVWTRPRDDA